MDGHLTGSQLSSALPSAHMVTPAFEAKNHSTSSIRMRASGTVLIQVMHEVIRWEHQRLSHGAVRPNHWGLLLLLLENDRRCKANMHLFESSRKLLFECTQKQDPSPATLSPLWCELPIRNMPFPFIHFLAQQIIPRPPTVHRATRPCVVSIVLVQTQSAEEVGPRAGFLTSLRAEVLGSAVLNRGNTHSKALALRVGEHRSLEHGKMVNVREHFSCASRKGIVWSANRGPARFPPHSQEPLKSKTTTCAERKDSVCPAMDSAC